MPEALNPEQQTAVERTEGPMLVLAGAGAGRIRIMAARIAHPVRRRGIGFGRILARSLTRRAGCRVRERAAAVLGEPARQVRLGSFRAFGLPATAGRLPCRRRRPRLSVPDAEVARALLAELSGARGEALSALAAEVARQERRSLLPEEPLAAAASPAVRESARRPLDAGTTRARSRRVLSRALARRSRSGRVPSAASRFRAASPKALLEPRARHPESAARTAAWHLDPIRAVLAAEAADGR